MPTNFGTGFGPSFGMSGWNNQQMTTPTKQQKFPGLSDDQIKRLESLTSNPQEQQKLYQQAIQQLKQQNTTDNRIAAENEMNYRSMNEKNPQQANYLQSNVRLEQLADLTKSAFGLDASADTQQVVNGLMAMAQDNGVSLSLLNDYLDHGDEEFLYQMGLKQDPALQTNPDALSIKGSIANANEDKGEWNDNFFGRLETKGVEEGAGFWKNAGRFIGNVAKSGVNVLSDVGNMILNPLDTANALAKTAVGAGMNLLGTDDDIEYMQDGKLKDWYMSANETADTVGQFFKERYGGGEEILNTLFTDPVGVISDVASILEGGAGAVRGIAKGGAKGAAKAGLKGAARTLDNVAEGAGKVSRVAGTYDPYAVAMRAETQLPIKAISATVDVAKKVPGASAKMKNNLNVALDKAVGLDNNTRLAIQSNPFSKEVWQKAKTYIDANGLPEKSTEVSKQLITDVADRVQETMLKQMDEIGETGPMYQPLREAGYSVDLSAAKAKLPEILEEYGITVNENGRLDFSKSSISSEASDIQKIYNRIENTDAPMSMDEYLRFRKTASDMVNFNPNNKNYIGKKIADTPGDKVIKAIREAANDTAHEQVAPLKDLDAVYNKQMSLIQEVTDGIVYKDKSKAGAVRDNINQIIKNLDEPNRRVLKNRLEKVLPGIEEEVKAINMLPKLIDNYYRPSKAQKYAAGTAGSIIGSAIGGGPLGGIIGAGVGYWLSGKIDKLKSAKWDKIISTTSKEGADKMADIQNRIANNQKITQAQKAFLNEISNKLKAGKQVKEGEIARIIGEVASAEDGDVLSVIDRSIQELKTIGAKEEIKELTEMRDNIQKAMNEEADMNRYAQDFEAEKQSILNEAADQRLPEFKRRIYQLQQQEKRIGAVANKKIGKTFEGRDFKKRQNTEWLKKKEGIIKDIEEYYNVDQFEAAEIFDRIERQASADDVGFSKSQASSKTAKYQVADQTNTPEFKKWFGDSKVVDNGGNPLEVYHATKADFNTFDRSKIGEGYGTSFADGFYFSDKPLREYGDIKKTFLKIDNPLVIDDINDLNSVKKYLKELGISGEDAETWYKYYGGDGKGAISKAIKESLGEDAAISEILKKKGYDGVVMKDTEMGMNNKVKGNEYIVFEPNQIKSATDNIGTFDKNNPDIRYQKYGVAGQGEKGISAAEGLNIRNFKNGKTVQELANQYGIDTKIVDSISTPEGQRAYGMYGDRLITLSKDLVESTVPHELLHGVFDMVDESRKTSILEGIQKKLNLDNVQAEEWLADNFSEYYRTGKFGTTGLAKTFVEKVKQFFYEVKSYIDGTYKNEKQIRQLFDDIIDGKIEGEYGVYSDPKFQSVWHGSHADFEKFDSSHMSEGEGGQAHGWGHYVAKEEKTGRHYAEMKYGPQYKGQTFGELTIGGLEENQIRGVMNRVMDGKTPKEGIKEMLDIWENYLENEIREFDEWKKKYDRRAFGTENEGWKIGEYEKKIDRFKRGIEILKNLKEEDFTRPPRNLYEVEIPDPVKRDTPTGSNYWEESGVLGRKELDKIVKALEEYKPEKIVEKGEDLPRDTGSLIEEQVKRNAMAYLKADKLDGEGAYLSLSNYLGSDEAASKFLESLGYDGIHYFGGRDGEAWVIFNDDALEITKHHKY